MRKKYKIEMVIIAILIILVSLLGISKMFFKKEEKVIVVEVEKGKTVEKQPVVVEPKVESVKPEVCATNSSIFAKKASTTSCIKEPVSIAVIWNSLFSFNFRPYVI